MILIPVILALGAVIYALTLASFAWEDLVTGVGVTAALLIIFHNVVLPKPLPSSGRILTAIVWFPAFVVGCLRDMTKGTWLVARYVVGIRPLEHPGIVRIPIGPRTPVSRGMAGFVITLSPGTFLLEIDEETDEMLIHAIDATDPDALRQDYESFYERFERHVVPAQPEEGRQ
jgi:multicomponent Na+:H+ antiporter subunit E